MTRPKQAVVLRLAAMMAVIAGLFSGSLATIAAAQPSLPRESVQAQQDRGTRTLDKFEVSVTAAVQCETQTVRAVVTVVVTDGPIVTQDISARIVGYNGEQVSYSPADRFIGQSLMPGTYEVEAILSNVPTTGSFEVTGRAVFDAQRATKDAVSEPVSLQDDCGAASPTATSVPPTATAPAPTATTAPAGTATLSVNLEVDCASEYNTATATATVVVTGGSVTVDQFTPTLQGSSGGTSSITPSNFVGQTLAPGTYTVTVQFNNFTQTAPTYQAVINATFSGIPASASDTFSPATDCTTVPTPTQSTAVPTPTQGTTVPTPSPSPTAQTSPTPVTTTPTSQTPPPPPEEGEDEGRANLSVNIAYNCEAAYNVVIATIQIVVADAPVTVDALTAALEGANGAVVKYTPDNVTGQRLAPGRYEVQVEFGGFTIVNRNMNVVVNATFSGGQAAANAAFALQSCTETTSPPVQSTATVEPTTGSNQPPTGNPPAPGTTPTAAAAGGAADNDSNQDVAGASDEDEQAASQPQALLPATGPADAVLLGTLALAFILVALGASLRARRLRRE